MHQGPGPSGDRRRKKDTRSNPQPSLDTAVGAVPMDIIDAVRGLAEQLRISQEGSDEELKELHAPLCPPGPAQTLAQLVREQAIAIDRAGLEQFYRSDRFARQLEVMRIEALDEREADLSPEGKALRAEYIRDAVLGAMEKRTQRLEEAAEALSVDEMLFDAELTDVEALSATTRQFNEALERARVDDFKPYRDLINTYQPIDTEPFFDRFSQSEGDELTLDALMVNIAGLAYLAPMERSGSRKLMTELRCWDLLCQTNVAERSLAAQEHHYKDREPERRALQRAVTMLEQQDFSFTNAPSIEQTAQALRQAFRDEFETFENFMAYHRNLVERSLRLTCVVLPSIRADNPILRLTPNTEADKSLAGITRAILTRRLLRFEQAGREYFGEDCRE